MVPNTDGRAIDEEVDNFDGQSYQENSDPYTPNRNVKNGHIQLKYTKDLSEKVGEKLTNLL